MRDCILSFGLFLLLPSGALHADYRETIGWDRLEADVGENLPIGRGIDVSLIESPPSDGVYQPDTGNFEFAGKTFSMKSGDTGVSSHATVVGQLFFGSWSSMADAIDTIDVYNSDDWLFDTFLRAGEDELPNTEVRRIQNHSWAGTFPTKHDRNIETIRRLDYSIDRDGYVAVVALGNNTLDLPALLAHSYNAIAVGRPDGNHSRNGTWFDGSERTRPDLVTPGGFFTSYSAPVVSSAVAVLLEEADRTPALANARRNPQVIKSILMTGATKSPFPDWSRSSERPLDPVFGAGQLDIYQSYRILTGGEYAPQENDSAPASGWDFSGTLSETGKTYSFSFDQDQESFTANLSWHRLIAVDDTANFIEADILVGRFDLQLFEADGNGLGEPVQLSSDGASNTQHLYLEDLPSGEYALVVNRIDDRSSEAVPYALAWNAQPAPIEPPANFTDWRARFFSGDELDDPKMAAPGADPDGDGIANLLEYALGGDPRQPNRRILPVQGTAVHDGERYLTLTFTHTQGLEDIEYRTDTSDNLSTWTEGTGVLIDASESEDGTVTATYRGNAPLGDGGRHFLRLHVELETP